MLANSSKEIASGSLYPTIQLPATSKLRLVDFLVKELPRWRDFPDRPDVTAETRLTEHLCDYLSSAAYRSSGWTHVQFRTEVTDEATGRGNRKMDLTAKPLACEIVIGNKRHTIFDPLFPVECKRLPTPKGTNREEKEYVTTQKSTTGGIQRFKYGHHGAEHEFAAMIGYIQAGSFATWLDKINDWIGDLALTPGKPWSVTDKLQKVSEDSTTKCSLMSSNHERTGSLTNIALQHLWIEMNGTVAS